MSITRDFKLSLVAGRSVPLVINANQYDDGEIWRFTLLDENGQKYSPSTGSIIGLKSDGHIIANAGTVSSTGLVIIPETEQMTASPGKNIFELLIDDDTHGTANFIVFVEPRPGAGGTPSDSDLAVFQEAIDAAAQIGDASELVDDVAVLEARMDEFTTLTDGSTTGDAELADIRVGADGTIYPNAGDAVRGQVSDLKNALNVNTNIPTSWVQGFLNSSTGQLVYSADSCSTEFISGIGTKIGVEVENGYQYKIVEYNIDESFSKVLVPLTSNTGEYVARSNKKYRIQVTTTASGGVIRPSGVSEVINLTIGVYTDESLSLQWKSADAKATGKLKQLLVNGYQQNLFSIHNAVKGFLTSSGGVSGDQLETNRTTDFISVGSNKNITIQTWMEVPSGTSQWQAFCFYDSEKALIGSRLVHTGDVGNYSVYTVSIPNNSTYVRASSRVYNDWKIMLQFGDTSSAWEYNYDDIDWLKSHTDEVVHGFRSNVKAIAHRGSNIAPENTMAGFKYAVENGFEYIETDLAFTSDNVPVLLHDTTINRTARNADGTQIQETINIYDITYEQALQYDFGIWKGSKFAGEKIPTLDQFLSFCRNTGTKPYLELKYDSHFPYALVTTIPRYFKKYGLYDDSTIISFIDGYLTEIKNLYPDLRIGVLRSEITNENITFASGLKTETNEVYMSVSTVDSTMIESLITANIPLEMWTLTTENEIKNANQYVSGMTCDDINPVMVLYNNAML